MAKLYFRYGAMGSSKTAQAIMVGYNYAERGQRVLMLKPRLEETLGRPIRWGACLIKKKKQQQKKRLKNLHQMHQ